MRRPRPVGAPSGLGKAAASLSAPLQVRHTRSAGWWMGGGKAGRRGLASRVARPPRGRKRQPTRACRLVGASCTILSNISVGELDRVCHAPDQMHSRRQGWRLSRPRRVTLRAVKARRRARRGWPRRAGASRARGTGWRRPRRFRHVNSVCRTNPTAQAFGISGWRLHRGARVQRRLAQSVAGLVFQQGRLPTSDVYCERRIRDFVETGLICTRLCL